MVRFDNTQSLDGLWEFCFRAGEPSDEEVVAAVCDSLQTVPGCFDAQPPLFSHRGTGIYRRRVTAGGRLQFRFRGLGLRARVFLDGKLLGTIPYAFTPFDFIVEDVPQGEHDLRVAVTNVLDEGNSSMFHEFYDFYAYGGLYRPVEMRTLKQNFIRDFRVTTVDVARGIVRVRLEVEKAADCDAAFLLNGRPLCRNSLKGNILECELTLPPPLRPWSPETPNLYTLRVELPFDAAETEFGLRTLQWNGGDLRLNGEPLKLIGFCRHDSHPDSGYAISPVRVLADLQMLKAQGCNFLRGSHYMQSDFLLDCCDRLGILVWSESCGWGNKAAQCADARFQELQLDQLRRMVREDANHPSIILWGFMNELASDTPEGRGLLEKLFKAVHAEDPSRPATYASNRAERDICYDLADVVATNLYPGWYAGWGIDEMGTHDAARVPEALTAFERLLSTPPCAGKP